MRTCFEINDNTGSFKIVFYQKEQNTTPTALKNFEYVYALMLLVHSLLFSHHMYVKVYGSVRVFKDEKALVGTHIKKVEKFDEITNHFLQVFVAHNLRTKGVLTVSDKKHFSDQYVYRLKTSRVTT